MKWIQRQFKILPYASSVIQQLCGVSQYFYLLAAKKKTIIFRRMLTYVSHIWFPSDKQEPFEVIM